MNATSKIILRPDYIKIDGTKSIYLRLTINRKVTYYSLNLSCLSKHWNSSKCRVSKTTPNSHNINILIDKNYVKAQDIIYDYEKDDKTLTFLEFEQHFKNNHYNNKSFYTFAQDQANKYSGKFKPGTIKGYKDQISKLKAFIPELMFSELNSSFMIEYERYLRGVRGNNQNTSNKSLIFIKQILNKAVDEGLIKENLCNKFKLKRKEGKREKLTLNEVDILSKLLNSGKLKPNKENVLRYFLFCCYTGLRYSDIRTLKHKDIVNDIVSIRMHKTEDYVRIPLIEKAKILMPKNSYFSNQNIFKVLTDQPTNRYLKEIMIIASINKHISFHCSRHTSDCLKT